MLHLGSWICRIRRVFSGRRRCRSTGVSPDRQNSVRLGLEPLEHRALPSAGTGTGLLGQYFRDQSLTTLYATRTDPAIHFNWSNLSPIGGIGTENYSVRWSGQLEALYSEPTKLFLHSDDGVRLRINGQTVIDSWASHPLQENQAQLNLEAGKRYNIELEYHQDSGDAVVRMFWQSASLGWSVVPTSQLYPSTPGTFSTPPTASLSASPVTTSGASSYSFTVTYRDDGQLDLNSLGWGDIRVVGPNGFSQVASFAGVTSPASNTWVAAYRITPPGGTWDPVDSGWYGIDLNAGQVKDAQGNYAPGQRLGSFQVNLSNWFSQNLQDPALSQLAQSLWVDRSLGRSDMLAIFKSVESGGVSSTELNDLRKLVASGATLGMPGHVQNLAHKVVNSDLANARFQGQPLGNLYAGAPAAHLQKLVDKWFRGLDRPAVDATGLTWSKAAGSLWGSSSGPGYADVKQGRLSDCYFVAALSETAHRAPQAIRDAFIDNGDGTWTVRFFRNGTPQYVTVDRYLPATSDGKLHYAGIGASIGDPNTRLWAPLLEKAYAQLAESGWSRPTASNSYAAIENGWEGMVIKHVTGKEVSSASITSSSLNSIVSAYQNGRMVLLDSKNATAPGIIHNHVYVVVGYTSATQMFSLYNVWGYMQQLSWSQISANFVAWTYTV
jgi:hypothetical protein